MVDESANNKMQRMARFIRFAAMKNLMECGFLTRERAEILLNAPVSPTEPPDKSFDDRKMLDWSREQWIAFLERGAE